MKQLKLVGNFLVVGCVLAVVGCGTAETTKIAQSAEDARRVYATGEAVDPAQAEVKLVKDATVAAATAQSQNLSVPSFSTALTVADHMQVMRCVKNFIFRTPDGRNAEDIKVKDVKDSENMRYAWVNALAHTADCLLVSNRISRDQFFDMSAKNGDFFYILNPCIDTNRSIYPDVNHPQQCSYKLAFTKPINFIGSLSAEILATAQKLNDAEGKFSAMFTQMHSLTSYIQLKQKGCMQEAIVDQARRSAFSAVTTLVSMAVPAVSSTIISGPIAEILGVRSIFDVAKKFVLGISDTASASTGSAASVACPVADNLKKQFEGILASVDGSLKSVIDIRNQMTKLSGAVDEIDLGLVKK